VCAWVLKSVVVFVICVLVFTASSIVGTVFFCIVLFIYIYIFILICFFCTSVRTTATE